MYYNRDLSWLEFNYRVLREATCGTVPLYDRMKFLSIFSSNFDEFFSIRYPVILAISNLKIKVQRKINNEQPGELLQNIQLEIERQFLEFNSILKEQVIPELATNNIALYYDEPLKKEHREEVQEIFLSKVLSFLQPIFLDGDILKRFEPEANKLYMIISLDKKGDDVINHAIIKVPSDSLKRFYKLSPIAGRHYVVFIDDVIRENARLLFPGYDIAGIYSIKFNRNEDLDFREDYRRNMLKIIEKQLAKRARGLPSRFVFQSSMPGNVQLYLASIFRIDHDEIFAGSRYHNLSDLSSFPVFDRNLMYEEWKPLPLFRLFEAGGIFKGIGKRDVLLHFPYHSFNPILSFFNQAAIDADVTEIYITLYRIASDSLIANALISAAKNGKKVTVFIELKARFDEANNINWAKKMKKAGIRIIYSIPGIKVHTKVALVIQQKDTATKMYSLVSTGNFNEMTARFYTDHTLLTQDNTINSELLTLFRFLEKREAPAGGNTLQFKTLLVSRFNMIEIFEELVKEEIRKVQKTGKGLIRIKLNNLEETGMIERLYQAGQAGVTVHLIVRSISCIVPGIPGISENIKVKRIVDRYLEHTRLFIFGNNEEGTVVIGSSDWMTRNLYHRIEVCVPVADPVCRSELLDYFELQWQDNDKSQCINEAAEPVDGIAIQNAQLAIYNYLKNKP